MAPPGALLNQLWAIARTNVGRIKNDDFRYLLKYVTKSGEAPEWIRGRTRLGVFQSSRGFLKPALAPDRAREPETPKLKRLRRREGTIGERLARWQTQALFQQAERFSQIQLRAPFGELLAAHVSPAAEAGRYLGNGHIQINDIDELVEWL